MWLILTGTLHALFPDHNTPMIAIASMIVVLATFAQAFLALVYCMAVGGTFWPLAVVNAILAGSILTGGVIGYSFQVFFTGQGLYGGDLLVYCLTSLAVCEAIIIYLHPGIYTELAILLDTRETRSPAKADRPHPEGFMEICGKVFLTAEPVILQAERDYVFVISRTSRNFVRAKISKIAAELPESIGFQVHRSYWVSRSAIKSVRRFQPRRATISTCFDIDIPVSRNRMDAFDAWLGDRPLPLCGKGRVRNINAELGL